jgi:hypothetical protein
MNAQELYRSFQQTEKFRNLSYNDQMLARQQFLDIALPMEPTFAALAPQDKQEIYKSLINAPPTLSNPSNQTANSLIASANAAKSGDEAAFLEALSRTRTIDQFDNLGIGGRLQLAVEDFLGDGGLVNRDEIGIIRDVLNSKEGSDERKAREYLSNIVAQESTPGQRTTSGALRFGAVAANVLFGRAMAGGLLGASKNAIVNAGALTAKGRLATWMMGSALPELVEAGYDGLILTAGDALNNGIRMDSNSVAWNVAKHYGVEVAADMAVWDDSFATRGDRFRYVAICVRWLWQEYAEDRDTRGLEQARSGHGEWRCSSEYCHGTPCRNKPNVRFEG